MGNTQKVYTTGRFGPRGGVGIRKRLLKVESVQQKGRTCPNCSSHSMRRKSKGVFFCRKCSHEFVGGAYLAQTLTGTIIRQMVSQKKFVPEMLEALEKTRQGEEATVEVQPQNEGKEEQKKGDD